MRSYLRSNTSTQNDINMDGLKLFNTELPSLRLLVLGDSGVGKTTLCNRICYNKLPKFVNWTYQANIDIMMYIYDNYKYFIEFIDISGSTTQKLSRKIYYKNINGIILVFDVNNKKSYFNLKTWLNEYNSVINNKDNQYNSNSFFPQIIIPSYKNNKKSKYNLDEIPIFLFGNKYDLNVNTFSMLNDNETRIKLKNQYDGIKDFGAFVTFFSSNLNIKNQKLSFNEFKKYLNRIIERNELKRRKSLQNFKKDKPKSIKNINSHSKSRFWKFWGT